VPGIDSLFVYGTLKRGGSRHDLLAQRADLVGEASFAGRLYDLGTYPGLVVSGIVHGRVQGEVFRLREPRQELLAQLDAYEGELFERKAGDVELAAGGRVLAWIYVYRGPTAGRPSIGSGRWGA
jgi:gamma-glutamylcyclotransferase (GGCT)/AIG2-like uncharacterized protein YtfP